MRRRAGLVGPCPHARARPGHVGVKIDNRGRIQVDPHFATIVPGIYAIGDVIAGPDARA